MLLATGCSLLPTSGVVHREADAGRVSPNDTAQFAPPGPGKGDSPTAGGQGVPAGDDRGAVEHLRRPQLPHRGGAAGVEPEPLDRGLPVQRDRPVARRRARDARRRPAPRLPGRLARRRRRGQRPARPAAGARQRGVADRQPAGRRRGAGVVPRQPVRPGQPLLLRPDQPGAGARAHLSPAGRAARVHPGTGAAGRAGRRARRGDPHRLPARHPARPVRAGRARRDGRGAVERGDAAGSRRRG